MSLLFEAVSMTLFWVMVLAVAYICIRATSAIGEALAEMLARRDK